MAQRTVTLLTSDVSGTEMAQGEGSTIKFGWLGTEYEIDLTNEEVDEFSKVLDPYVSVARRMGRNGKAGARTTVSPSYDTNAVREWAKENGYEVSERGRIKKDVLEAYEAANKG